jgi:beta-lactamase class C
MNQAKILTILIGALLGAVPVRGQGNVEAIVAQNVRPLLPQNGRGGGVAVAVRMNGNSQFFNYGFANLSRNERVTADSIFNLGSVGKLFATTILAEAVKRGELSFDIWIARPPGAIRAVASRQIHVARFRPVSQCLEGGPEA